MDSLISLSRITKQYQKMRALNEIDIEIGAGVTGLLGPNGAGKSTLIKVILGLIKVTTGSGCVLGHQLGKHGRAIRNKIGYMPEDDCYIPGMTGVEVVQFAAALSGLPHVEGLRRSHEILDFCGMKQERYRKIETFSTGMRQKIKFASSIVHDPELLILDEPTSGLDPEERELMLNRIHILSSDSGKSVVLSTHILPDVQMVCDHALIIAGGQLVLSESLQSLNRTSSPALTIRISGPDEATFINSLKDHCDGVSQTNDLHWLVTSNQPNIIETIWESAAKTNTNILSIAPAKNDLEAVFLKSVQEAEDAHS